jgi:pimeloyl-ACP methyl ester carboxylesterase
MVVGVLGAGLIATPVGAEAPLKKGICAQVTLPVALQTSGTKDQWVRGTLCHPFRMAQGKHELDILTEGATYNSTYWDWPIDSSQYSYVNKTLAEGRATFAYDRIGAGKSSHPVSTDITEATDAYVLHQIISMLQKGGYKKINSIGHSYGSGIALEEAATYKDVSRLVLTGYLHRASNPAVTAGNYPANQDPAFLAAGLDAGYLTTRPGARQTSFYSSSADPQVVAYDEVHKDLVSRTGLLDFIAKRGIAPADNISAKVTTPVLLVTGEQDAIFCYDSAAFNCSDTSMVRANEAPYYAHARSLQVFMITATGHDIALHPTADRSFALINRWIKGY